MDVSNVENSGEFVASNDVDQNEMFRNSFLNHRESDKSDDDVSVNFNDTICKKVSIFFRNSLEDEAYQDELFREEPDESEIYPKDKILEKEDFDETSKFSKNQFEPMKLHNNRDSEVNISSEIAASQIGSNVSSKNHHKQTVKSNLKDQEILSDGEYCNESEDSIFESVSVAYENRMKNLENVKQESKENETNDNCEEEFDMIDDKLMRELLEFTIAEQHPSTIRLNFAASKTIPSPSNNVKNPSRKTVPTKQRHASPNSVRLRESQKRLESMLKKFNNGTSNKQKLQSMIPKSKAGLPDSQHQDLATPNLRNIQSRMQPGTGSSTSRLEKERYGSAKSRSSSSVCSTPRPAFRAGSMTDFSRKLDEDGRRNVTGKNNPYRKLRPRPSHKTSYVDEMLFGTRNDSSTTWQAPWQPKSKPVRPHFCDWVWDRRKSPKT